MRRRESKIAVLILALFAVVAIIGYAAGREGMTETQLIAQIQKNWDEIWVKGNLDAMDEASALLATSYTDDAVIHELRGPDTAPVVLKKSFAWFRSQFSDTRVIVDEVISEEDRMVIQYTMNAKLKGPSNLMQCTFQNLETGESQSVSFPVSIGTKLSFKGCGVLRLVDGKIAEEWGYSDSIVMPMGIAFRSEWIEQ